MFVCVVSASNQVFEVNTPNLAFTMRQAGEYRITVDPDGNATTIFVRKGKGEAYGDGAAYVLDSRQPYRFTGQDCAITAMSTRRALMSLTAGQASATAGMTTRARPAMSHKM